MKTDQTGQMVDLLAISHWIGYQDFSFGYPVILMSAKKKLRIIGYLPNRFNSNCLFSRFKLDKYPKKLLIQGTDLKVRERYSGTLRELEKNVLFLN